MKLFRELSMQFLSNFGIKGIIPHLFAYLCDLRGISVSSFHIYILYFRLHPVIFNAIPSRFYPLSVPESIDYLFQVVGHIQSLQYLPGN